MTTTEIIDRLDRLANTFVPVAGTLMQIACSNGRSAREPDIHEADCDCQVCKAFTAVQAATTELDAIVKAMREEAKA